MILFNFVLGAIFEVGDTVHRVGEMVKKDMMKKSKQIVEAEEDTVATINDDIKMDGWIENMFGFVF